MLYVYCLFAFLMYICMLSFYIYCICTLSFWKLLFLSISLMKLKSDFMSVVKHSLCKSALFSFPENTLLFFFQICINLNKQFRNDNYLSKDYFLFFFYHTVASLLTGWPDFFMIFGSVIGIWMFKLMNRWYVDIGNQRQEGHVSDCDRT